MYSSSNKTEKPRYPSINTPSLSHNQKVYKDDRFNFTFESGLAFDEFCEVSPGLGYGAGMKLTNTISTHYSHMMTYCETGYETYDQIFNDVTLRYTSPTTGVYLEFGNSNYEFNANMYSYSTSIEIFGFGYSNNQDGAYSEIKFKYYPEDYADIILMSASIGFSF